MFMNKDTIAGAAKQAAGSAKEALGKVIGDVKLKEAGKAEKAAGKAESEVGKAQTAVDNAAGKAKEKARSSSGLDDFSVSAELGLPLLSDDPTPLSSALHIPTLLDEAKTKRPIK